MFAAPSALCLWHSLAGARVGGWPSSPAKSETKKLERAMQKEREQNLKKEGRSASKKGEQAKCSATSSKVGKPNAAQIQGR
eukprot:1002782-Pelagomonas_calceolata.AAC.3